MPPPPPPPRINPYAAPTAPYAAGPSGSLAEAERIRHELLKHEVGVQTIGSLYLLSAILGGVAVLGLLVATLMGGSAADQEFGPGPMLVTVVIGGLGIWLYIWLGTGLRRLDRKVRTVAIVLSAIGLLGFPLGTLISAYFLYLLASDKGSRVLSPEYQAVVAATPHIKYKSPWALGCLIAIAVLGAIAAIAYYTSV